MYVADPSSLIRYIGLSLWDLVMEIAEAPYLIKIVRQDLLSQVGVIAEFTNLLTHL